MQTATKPPAPIFTERFDSFVCEGDTIKATVGKFELIATVHRDDSSDAPDENDDGFWPSLDPKSAGYIGPKSKSTLARHMAKAQRIMDAWKNDEWFYCGIDVRVLENGVELVDEYQCTLWGVECNYPDSDNSYLAEVANDLAHQALEQARATLAKLCAQ